MKIFYHGSPTPNIEVLEPRLDPRLGVEGVFVADEPFGPMMFSLLPERAHATVNWKTDNGKFIEGKVITPVINEEGWLYTIQAESENVKEGKSGQFYLTAPASVVKVEKISKEKILNLGWKVEIRENKEPVAELTRNKELYGSRKS
jgi:hypothetical protein